MALNNGDIFSDILFNLYDHDGNEKTLSGAYLLSDNGYLKWRVLQCPVTHPLNMEEHRFSKWLESMRKDVECFFGILKGRWRILKHAILVQDATRVDNIVYTCVALHNQLLHIDGLHTNWGTGAKSDWEEEKWSVADLEAHPPRNGPRVQGLRINSSQESAQFSSSAAERKAFF